MRLTTVILIASLMQVSAAGFAQKISLSKSKAPLKSVLKEMRQQSGYVFLYNEDLIKSSKPVSIKVSNAEFEDVLEQVFKDQPLTYSVNENTITIKEKEPTFLERLAERWASIDVSGRVVDADGRGLPGASVSVKGKGKAVSTGADGSFYLKGVDEEAVLVISFIGYVNKEVKAVKELGDVVLELSTSKLDEVQVIAYGTTTQRLSTGNVTTIKADVIEKQPVNNPLLALQGRVPGLFIEQATGFAGTGVKVRIQGQNSMLNGNDPLYVIDGVQYSSQLLPGSNYILTGLTGGVAGSPLNYINPADIESIDILKDADATAIYGSKAANGAILITTKKGKVGDLKIETNFQRGWGRVPNKLDLMNSTQYLMMRNEALKNDGILTPSINDYDLNGTWDTSRNADWQKELIGGSALYNDIQASVSGGGNTTTFLVGAGYHKEGNVIPGDFSDQKNSVHFSLGSSSSNQRFRIQLSGIYMRNINALPGIDLTSAAITMVPVAPPLYSQDGTINWQPDADGVTTFSNNPIGYLYQKFQNKYNNLIGNSILSYQIIPGLEIKTSFGYNKLQSNTIFTQPPLTPEQQLRGNRSTTFGRNDTEFWSVEPQITYINKIAKGKLELLLGSTLQNESKKGTSITATGFTTDQVMEDIGSATSITPGRSFDLQSKYNAIFGRINYNWEDKYILNFTARRDGSSRFGSANQFHNFGAIGTAWIFSQEKIITKNFNFLSFGKLRASYGTTGSDQISDYQYLSLYGPTGVSVPYQGVNGYLPVGLSNPYLQWEETKKISLGLDLGFFHDKIILNINHSQNRSSNQLLYYNLPITTGFYNIQSNFPATIQNTSWEFIVSSTNIQTHNFKWFSSLNLTIPKNKLVSFADFESSGYTSAFNLGQSINIQKLIHSLGVDPARGTYQFQDRNGNVTEAPLSSYYPENDALVIISTDPKYYGGIQNSFSYKQFQLDFLFQFTKQIGKNYTLGNILPGAFESGNQPVNIINRWKSAGDIAPIQRYNTDFSVYNSYVNAYYSSDANWSDASYVRLKNVSLSWQIPDFLKKSLHFKNLRIYAQGQNLWTITNYFGLDPETKSSSSLPPLRVITIGLQVGL